MGGLAAVGPLVASAAPGLCRSHLLPLCPAGLNRRTPPERGLGSAGRLSQRGHLASARSRPPPIARNAATGCRGRTRRSCRSSGACPAADCHSDAAQHSKQVQRNKCDDPVGEKCHEAPVDHCKIGEQTKRVREREVRCGRKPECAMDHLDKTGARPVPRPLPPRGQRDRRMQGSDIASADPIGSPPQQSEGRQDEWCGKGCQQQRVQSWEPRRALGGLVCRCILESVQHCQRCSLTISHWKGPVFVNPMLGIQGRMPREEGG